MKSREVFRLAVKIIGFIIVLQGFRNCVEGLLILKGYRVPAGQTLYQHLQELGLIQLRGKL